MVSAGLGCCRRLDRGCGLDLPSRKRSHLSHRSVFSCACACIRRFFLEGGKGAGRDAAGSRSVQHECLTLSTTGCSGVLPAAVFFVATSASLALNPTSEAAFGLSGTGMGRVSLRLVPRHAASMACSVFSMCPSTRACVRVCRREHKSALAYCLQASRAGRLKVTARARPTTNQNSDTGVAAVDQSAGDQLTALRRWYPVWRYFVFLRGYPTVGHRARGWPKLEGRRS